MKRIITVLFILLGLPFVIPVQAQGDITWTGQYYNNGYLGGSPDFTRQDASIAFNWGFGSPPGVAENNFSVRWTASTYLPAGTYRFYARADDNVSIFVDNRMDDPVLDTFQTAQVGERVSGDVTLEAGQHTLLVNYREITEEAYIFVDIENVSDGSSGPDFDTPSNVPITRGTWYAEYYPNISLSGTPRATQTLYNPSADWGAGAPVPNLEPDTWSARFSSTQTLGGGTYRMRVDVDDGVRVYVDDDLVIDEWHEATREIYTETFTLDAGAHTFIIEMYESEFSAYLDYDFNRLNDTTPGDDVVTDERVVLLNGPLYVRDAPNTVTGGVMNTLNTGAQFYLTGRERGAWDEIIYNGTTGWVNGNVAEYSTPNTDTPLPVPEDDIVFTDATLVSPTYYVNIRQGPSTQYTDIGNLPPDRTVNVIGRTPSSTWFKINYNDIVGWVTGEYTRLQPGVTVDEIPVTEVEA